jgi:hypothetical protein
MPLACIQGDLLDVTAAPPGYLPFTPNPASITATGFATINSNNIMLQGDVVIEHTATHATTPQFNPPIVHTGATMTSTQQSFFRVSNKLVVLNTDPSTCDGSHTVSALTQGFVNVIPK